MWILILVASVGFKTINTSQILGTGIQDNHNKTSICNELMATPLSCDRTIYCSGAMFEYLRMNVNNSSLQTSERNENDMSGWNRAGIYGIEFLAGGAVNISCLLLGYRLGYHLETPIPFIIQSFFTLAGIPLTGAAVWGAGKLLGQEGSFWKATVGVVGGYLITIGGYSLIMMHVGERTPNTLEKIGLGICLGCFPSLGATIGYNFK